MHPARITHFNLVYVLCSMLLKLHFFWQLARVLYEHYSTYDQVASFLISFKKGSSLALEEVGKEEDVCVDDCLSVCLSVFMYVC